MSRIIAVDQSTSATKALLFDEGGGRVARVNRAHRQYYPQPGWVEHDLEEIYRGTCDAVQDLVREHGVGGIECLSITNQRETVALWDRRDGRPLCRALVWQDGRAAEICRRLAADGLGDPVTAKTGLPLDPYFSGGKAAWAIESIPAVRQAARDGALCIGTIDSWLIYRLTGLHATDTSNACRTLLFDIHALRWDSEIAEAFGVPLSALPEVRPSDAEFGRTRKTDLGIEVPIRGVAGDSHAALFGQRGFDSGRGKATYGTGSSVMVNVGTRPVAPPPGIALSIGWTLGEDTTYVFEGNVHSTGDTLRWAVENLGLAADIEEATSRAYEVASSEGVYIVPGFGGLGAPYWDNDARALICGISRGTDRRHILRAAIDSIAHQVTDVVEAMAVGVDLRALSADGGPTRNRTLMQLQADLMNETILTSEIEELSALGAAFLGGVGTVWPSLADISTLPRSTSSYEPAMPEDARRRLRGEWADAVSRARSKGES